MAGARPLFWRAVALLVALAVVADLAPAAAANAIGDGGFESGTLAGPFSAPLPVSVGTWARINLDSRLVNPPNPVHAGQWSLAVDTQSATFGSDVYQDFDSGTLSYTWTFWMYAGAGRTVAEVVYNWDRGGGFALLGSEFLFARNSTRFRAWGGVAFFPPASLGAWHEMKVVANRCTQMQDVYMDGALLGTVAGTTPPPAGAATVILGDVANFALHGLTYFDDVSFDLFDCAANMCPLSHGYWKNHPGAWPVASLALGSEAYSEGELISLMKTPARGDASLILGYQLIAAKLNIANGSDATPVAATIARADAALASHAGRLPYGVKASSSESQIMITLGATLDRYNNGFLSPGCAHSEDVRPPSFRPGGAAAGLLPSPPVGRRFDVFHFVT